MSDKKLSISPTEERGMDGYGYLTTDDLQTVRVALQAKKWTNSVVSSPGIDKFRGAMDKFRNLLWLLHNGGLERFDIGWMNS